MPTRVKTEIMDFKTLNIISGWFTFLVAAIVYLATLEPTASLWDCGEYIVSCYKLEVGHPPGAPFFLLVGRLFTLLAGGDVTQAAYWVNVMSALCSAFTILFLFWCITALTRKLAEKNGALDTGRTIAIIGSGLVGALAFTFSDSFWFSAVEGEVYAMSSTFTALVFWAMLKWEQAADDPGTDRWIILISLFIGISVGVHLLNLLAIPALVFIYYFRKFKPSRKGVAVTGIVAVLLLGTVQSGIIPGVVKLSAMFELFFVNTLGMPFNTGTVIYLLLIIGALVYGIRYTHRKGLIKQNTILLSITMLLIGYSSFFVLIIRSQANTPMDQNNPDDAISLLSYLNREQYGSWPLLYGPYYNSPLDRKQPYKDSSPVYRKDEQQGKYMIVDDGKNSEPNYDKEFSTLFPRMYSQQDNHEAGYKQWADIKGERKSYINFNGERETIIKPTFSENLKYFFSYQVNHMYWRYFMWNFVGRQNDTQGSGSISDGNWITGIQLLDEWRLGQQEKLTTDMQHSKARNAFYGLPLLLGLAGFIYHYRKSRGDAFVVLLLFVTTGLAIVLYINQHPFQPRERDYSYVGSFFAFAIWIGIGVYAIIDLLKKRMKVTIAALATTVLCIALVPGLMAKEGWGDHDRSYRTIARDIAYNALNTCAKNAILFTHGDNDTFPLWYAQEVEGIRTDVRVIVLNYFNIDWYIDQMKRRAYDSDPIPLSLPNEKYRASTRNYLPIIDRGIEGYTDIKELMAFITSEDPQTKIQLGDGKLHNYLPTRKIRIPVNKEQVLKNNVVAPEMEDSIVPYIEFELQGNYILKNTLMTLDLLAGNNWERPIYFGIPGPQEAFRGLDEYLQLEGLAYRLVPLKQDMNNGYRVNTKAMFHRMMNVYQWGNLDKPGVLVDSNIRRTIVPNMRIQVVTLASALIAEGKKEKALQVLDKCMEKLPAYNIPHEASSYNMLIAYYQAGDNNKAGKMAKELFRNLTNDLEYYYNVPAEHRRSFERSRKQAESILTRIIAAARHFGNSDLARELERKLPVLLKNPKTGEAVQ